MRALHAARGRIAPLCSRGRFVSTAGALGAKRRWVRLGQLDREQERVGQLARTDSGRSRDLVARAEQILRTRGGVWPLRVERRGRAWRGRTLVCFSKSCVSASADDVSPGGASANGRQYKFSICALVRVLPRQQHDPTAERGKHKQIAKVPYSRANSRVRPFEERPKKR